MKIDLRKHKDKLFNKSFFEIRKAKTRFKVIYGGSGSGKSVSAHQIELEIIQNTDKDTLFIRKHGSDIKDSCFKLLKEQAERFKITHLFDWYYSQSKREIVSHKSGRCIMFRGIDDPEKVKSIVGIRRIVIEEASELDFADFRELNRRARGVKDIQIILILNPIDEEHWIKKQFVDPTGAYHNDTTILKYNYQANRFLTQEDIDELERLKLIDINEYNIYVLGMWGVRDNKRAWLFNFDKAKHVVEDLPFLPSYPVYLSFDFNNEPFACIAFQMSPQMGTKDSFIHIIREFSGHWKVDEMCQRIKASFPASILYVTGDRSGQNDDIGRNQTLYQMIAGFLGLSDKQMNLNSKNLEHADSRILCNSLFGVYPNIKVSGNQCKNLIGQCERAKVKEDAKLPGTLLKDREDHKNDEFDAMRYFFQTYFNEYAKKTYFKAIAKR